jgi:hypothetical protein
VLVSPRVRREKEWSKGTAREMKDGWDWIGASPQIPPDGDPLPWTVQFWSLGLDPCPLLALVRTWGFVCGGLASLGN